MALYEVIETSIIKKERKWLIEAESEMEAYNKANKEKPHEEKTTDDYVGFDVIKKKK